MEFGIGIGIGIVIALILGKRKKHNLQPRINNPDSDVERQRKQKADEELITVILPTINHDK